MCITSKKNFTHKNTVYYTVTVVNQATLRYATSENNNQTVAIIQESCGCCIAESTNQPTNSRSVIKVSSVNIIKKKQVA
jgi:hypothetical protein